MSTLLTSPHSPPNNSVTRVMLLVAAGLLPGYVAYIWFFGWGLLLNSIWCIATAYACEIGMLRIRQRPLALYLTDGSALVTALLIALALPPLLPWWLPVLATAFAIIIAKHLYGGLGYNPFNPAMVGYAMLLIAFPKPMTAWLPADHALTFMDSLHYSLFAQLPAQLNYDAVTMATPLDVIDIQVGLGLKVADIQSGFSQFSQLFGVGWDWISLLYLLGGIFLILKRVISWHIPLAMISTIAILSAIAYLLKPDGNPTPLFHILGGATMLGAFFIATDPVTASTTNNGRLLYGIGIGVITYVIRAWGGYPDGVAFGVLIMNMAVPTIDYYTQPRVFGHNKDVD